MLDLLINITDQLLIPPATVKSQHHLNKDLDSVVFIIFLIQIFAIVCVLIDLILHFFQASDQVQQFAWHSQHNFSDGFNQHLNDRAPLPQRVALKLVLDKYWWSLLVGLLYLVLTIILQIIRLDSSLNYQHLDNANISRAVMNLTVESDKLATSKSSANLFRMDMSELFINSNGVFNLDHESPLRPRTTGTDVNEKFYDGDETGSTPNSVLQILVLLVHKLMSTCYYVSFVVVYRATPNQMMNRIFLTNKSQILTFATSYLK